MERAEKVQEVEALKKNFSSANLTLLAEYQGLTVANLTRLRVDLRKNNAHVKIAKNTLSKRAIAGTELDVLKPYFEGSVMVVFAQEDPILPAKALVKFSEEFEKFKIKAGVLEGKLLVPRDIEGLSKLPSREELLAKMLGSLQSPAQKLVNVLSALPRQVVTVLAAIRDKKQ